MQMSAEENLSTLPFYNKGIKQQSAFFETATKCIYIYGLSEYERY
jgi:hypothetical protein